MFAPHKAKIKVRRRQPTIEEVERAKKILKRRIERLATAAVEKDKISVEKTRSTIAKVEKAVQKKIEFDDRKEALRNFIESFNKWRNYFVPDREHAWRPKTLGQLRMIERVVDVVQENDLNQDLFVACSFKAVEKWKFKVPAFNQMLTKGAEWYEIYCEDVLATIDAEEY